MRTLITLAMCSTSPTIALIIKEHWHPPPARPVPTILVGAAAAIRPNLPFYNDPHVSAWANLGLQRPNPMAYRLPSLPPIVNPVLARWSMWQPFPKGPNPGVPQLVYYDPNEPPPLGSVPLIPPTTQYPAVLGPPQWERDASLIDFASPVPLPPSYDDLAPDGYLPPYARSYFPNAKNVEGPPLPSPYGLPATGGQVLPNGSGSPIVNTPATPATANPATPPAAANPAATSAASPTVPGLASKALPMPPSLSR
eukprot:Blabericola_migrator_1__9363@NODE_5049_length_891_cov_45_382282_g3189_i0_p1_GENE_NODE_5049_length_891_cov_45_382282_g3189_i0NODE_5049_length_891_cov_45_382282_g3189_i0_p1_ORF_typecomplete_len253_score9_73_NODE_5049_length_891_cov_45_382282_g3189_i0111869